jgi:hypothetical protein
MRPFTSRHLLAALALVAGCSRAELPTQPDAATGGDTRSGSGAAAITGGGHYLLQGAFDTQFSVSAITHADDGASGAFHHKTEDSSGTIDFSGRVTCLAIDAANQRAWIGGVITENRSTHPAFTTTIHEAGHDIWFRVLDSGAGPGGVDRTSFIGFEGAIPSSASYCEQRIWPDGDARTWPVTSGNITVPP